VQCQSTTNAFFHVPFAISINPSVAGLLCCSVAEFHDQHQTK